MLVFRWNFMHFAHVHWLLSLDTMESERSLGSCSSFALIRCLCTSIRSPLCLLFSRLKCSSCLSLCSYKRCSGPLTVWVESAAQTQSPLPFLYSEIFKWLRYLIQIGVMQTLHKLTFLEKLPLTALQNQTYMRCSWKSRQFNEVFLK